MNERLRERRRAVWGALSTIRPMPTDRELAALTGATPSAMYRDKQWLANQGYISLPIKGGSRAVNILIPLITQENASEQ